MGYFPFWIDIENKKCVIVGGGEVALRKTEKLIPFQPDITVVAPEICSNLLVFPGVRFVKREFADCDIDGAFMVVSATNDTALNAHIYRMCSDRGIFINTVDDKEKCSFIFPALVKRDNITVAVSTGGKSPVYARYLRETIERSLDGDTDRIIGILSDVRDTVKHEIDSEERRKFAFERILKLALTDVNAVTPTEISGIIEELK